MVSDTGSGIPGDKLGQIFERFHRLEPSNKGLKEGHGIGLSVVKELVEKLNGKIEVSSEIGKGSVFTLKLPFKLSDRFSSKINYD
jgi:signal transduction histidine kinase